MRQAKTWLVPITLVLCAAVVTSCEFERSITPIVWPTDQNEPSFSSSLGPRAMDSPAILATTIGHETVHTSGLIEFGIDYEKSTYLPDEPIAALLTLTNVGKNEVLVNGRLIPNEQTAPERLRYIVFSIRGPAGKPLIPKILINVRAPGDTDFVLLAPGDSIEKEILLDEIYSFAQPGVYSVQAIYLNVSNPSESEAWKGQLSSNLATIRLEGQFERANKTSAWERQRNAIRN
ncbi:MAG: hypothetical protein ACE5JF_02120 [Anaerolineales bacterium]